MTATDIWACPDGELVLPTDADREDWLAERRKGVGGSDMAALFGEAAYGRTEYGLWLDKTGRVPEQDESEAMEWGKRFENAVAEKFGDETGIGSIGAGLMRSRHAPHVLVSVDRMTEDGGGLECKFQNLFKAREWGSEDQPVIPRQFYWQGVTALAVTGRSHWWFASVCGQRYIQRRLDLDECRPDVARVLEITEDWWIRHVYADEPPAAGMPDPALLTNPDLRIEASIPDLVWADVRRWAELSELLGKNGPLRAELEEIKARMRAELGTAEVLTVRGIPVVKMQHRAGRRKTDYDGLQREYPQAYAKYVSGGTGGSWFPTRIGRRDDDD